MFSFLLTLIVAVFCTAITLIKSYEYDSKLLTIFVSAVAVAFTGAQYFLLGLDSIVTAIIFVLILTLVNVYTQSIHMEQQGRTRKPLKWYHIGIVAVCSFALIALYELFITATPLQDIHWDEIGVRILLILVIPMSIGAFYRNRKIKRMNSTN
ncbi:hypothetical protein [Paenibacillus sp. Marseille-Q4541]|uniref:hypothetical protein n=1 Tax=Paenibacillus sp. Marseille-Q4541 TaxID=2831522 RepID=UPI001BA5B776|nr:hypothetical protein [Paenibacillus sp. Marseille-Q4541]